MSRLLDKLHQKLTVIAGKASIIIRFPKQVIGINKLIRKESYYPELPRKSKKEMWQDNFRWLCRHHELNEYYTSYGLDIKGLRDPDEFISHRDFCRWRNKGNQKLQRTFTGDYNYIALLRDKYLFSSYLASTIGQQFVVDNKALVSDRKAYLPSEKRWVGLDKLLSTCEPLVFKLIDGECADGVMLVEPHTEGVRIEGTVLSTEEFCHTLGARRYVVQGVVRQHSALEIFKTRSVNTIRMITICGESGEVNVFAAFLRLGGSADSFVDNRAKGGLGIGITLDTGELMKYGFPHDSYGVKEEIHPLSGVRFAGVKLPYWTEALELVKNAHRQFYEIQSIGWDVILTENGPVLLEGNDDWEISGPQDTCGGLLKRWNDLVSR